jgi:hypothetical protein
MVIAHGRRRIVHVAVTAHPTAARTAQQLREACPGDGCDAIASTRGNDRDGDGHPRVVTTVRSLWQNAYAERLIASIRRECLDHMVPEANRRHGRNDRSYDFQKHVGKRVCCGHAPSHQALTVSSVSSGARSMWHGA